AAPRRAIPRRSRIALRSVRGAPASPGTVASMDRGEPSGATPLAPSPGGRRASWYSLLRCPACRAVELARDISGVRCRACGVVHPDRGGYLDMLASSALGEPTPSTPEQRLMESELVARLYERF